jgi:CHAT domain-containing protein/tetratricopeptide (TPR) repeat protein
MPAMRNDMADDPEPSAENKSLDRAIELVRSGRFDEARAAAHSLLQIPRASPGAGRRKVASLTALAGACLALAQHADACHYAGGALALAEAYLADADSAITAALEILEDACLAMGNLTDAHAAAERALGAQIVLHGRDSVAAAKATQRLGVVLARLGDIKAARAAFLRAKDVLTREADSGQDDAEDALATTLGNLASTYHQPDEIEVAQALYDDALRLRRRLSGDEHPEIAQLRSNLGLLLSEIGHDHAALRSCEQSLALRRRLLAPGHPDIARGLMEVGWLRTRLGDADGAADALLEALLLLSALDMPSIEARAHFLLASLLAERGAAAAAIYLEKRCVNILQRLRGETGSHERAFLAARLDIYRHLAESLIRSGRLPEALQVIAMLRESELDEVTNGMLRPVTTLQLTRLEHAQADAESMLRTRIRAAQQAAGRTTPSEREAIAAQGTATLKAWFAGLRADFSGAEAAAVRDGGHAAIRPVSVSEGDQAAQILRLQYLLSQDRVDIILSTPDGQRHYESAFPPGGMHRLVLAFRASIGERSATWRSHAAALHDLLIGPVAAELDARETRQLTVSLDGVLRYLPFGALHDGQQHLLQRFALVVSAGAMGQARRIDRRSRRRATAFGATRALANHRALQGVREELLSIVRTADNRRGVLQGDIFLDEAFTADALRRALEARGGVVHIASHFVFRPAREDESYLLLGDGTMLSLAQLASLRFDGVELLTLSACDTAVSGGHRQSGSEFEGLGALALTRGAQHVVATLWPIRDFTSAAVMREFYRLRFRAGHGVAEALRRAQLQLLTGQTHGASPGSPRGLKDPDDDSSDMDRLHRHAHPYYWAPYVLME